MTINTIGDLRELIKDLPDSMPVSGVDTGGNHVLATIVLNNPENDDPTAWHDFTPEEKALYPQLSIYLD